jgi:hypothetical protein
MSSLFYIPKAAMNRLFVIGILLIAGSLSSCTSQWRSAHSDPRIDEELERKMYGSTSSSVLSRPSAFDDVNGGSDKYNSLHEVNLVDCNGRVIGLTTSAGWSPVVQSPSGGCQNCDGKR